MANNIIDNYKRNGFIVIGLIIFLLYLANTCENSEDEKNNALENTTENESTSGFSKDDILVEIEVLENRPFKKEYASKEEIIIEVAYFKFLGGKIYSNDTSKNLAVKKLTLDLKKKLVKLQKKTFPVLRDSWLKISKEKLWENNIEVVRNSSTSIMFVGGTFANNMNIKTFHEGIYELLMKLRFKRISYKWVDLDVEYTYYKLTSLDDGQLDSN